jgi:hypothetical protein
MLPLNLSTGGRFEETISGRIDRDRSIGGGTHERSRNRPASNCDERSGHPASSIGSAIARYSPSVISMSQLQEIDPQIAGRIQNFMRAAIAELFADPWSPETAALLIIIARDLRRVREDVNGKALAAELFTGDNVAVGKKVLFQVLKSVTMNPHSEEAIAALEALAIDIQQQHLIAYCQDRYPLVFLSDSHDPKPT